MMTESKAKPKANRTNAKPGASEAKPLKLLAGGNPQADGDAALNRRISQNDCSSRKHPVYGTPCFARSINLFRRELEMAAENTVAGDVINQRLDALDRVLLGLLPRNERLAMVADVEAKVRIAHEANPVSLELAAMPMDALPLSEAAAGQRPRIARRRSALALTSGVLGIVALALLFALPITYLVVSTTSEAIGEVTTYILLSGNIVMVALGGAAAVIMGIVALVRLNRQQGTQRGHGWAILALCAGPLPMFVGGLGTITMVLPMMAELASQHVQASSPSYVMLPNQSEDCAVCPTSESCSPSDGLQLPLVAAAPASNGAAPVAD